MKLDRERIADIFSLSSLKCREGEGEALQSHLEGMIEHLKDMESVDVAGVEPFFSLSFRDLPLEDDSAVKNDSRDALVDTFVERDLDYLSVKKVVHKGDS